MTGEGIAGTAGTGSSAEDEPPELVQARRAYEEAREQLDRHAESMAVMGDYAMEGDVVQAQWLDGMVKRAYGAWIACAPTAATPWWPGAWVIRHFCSGHLHWHESGSETGQLFRTHEAAAQFLADELALANPHKSDARNLLRDAIIEWRAVHWLPSFRREVVLDARFWIAHPDRVP